MKLHYLYHLDASQPAVQSGRPASILQALDQHGVEVERIFPLVQNGQARRFIKKLFWHATGHHYLTDREPKLLADLARQAKVILNPSAGDVIFSPSTLPLAFLQTNLPITFCADASFAIMVDYYDAYARLSPGQLKFAEKSEADVLNRSALAVYPSAWAARGAIKHYGLKEDRVAVIPFGANFGKDNKKAEVTHWIEARSYEEIRLLFVGREWKRKGGAIAVETARLLNSRGIKTRLDIVGLELPHKYRSLPFVHNHGLLSSSIPTERDRLQSIYCHSHFLFVPSRAEAYGMVFCEANAFGLPAISTATGGITGIVREGINGFLLPHEADAADYAKVIATAFENPDQYRALAQSSYQEFAERLNWDAFASNYLSLLDQRVLGRSHDLRLSEPEGWLP